MHTALTRLRASVRRSPMPSAGAPTGSTACSWEAMRATYEEQAARGVPEAVRGLALIEQGRWPATGRPRQRMTTTDG